MRAKAELRAKMQALRRSCTDRALRDSVLFERVTASELYRNAAYILCYVSFGSEADTASLIRTSLTDGKRVFVPRCVPNTNHMEFYEILSPGELSPGAYGIPEPPGRDGTRYDEQSPAVCFVPGLAFTREGMRLGYGKGYYDTFLEKMSVCTIGLCYDFQLVDSIPAQPHDRPVDYIITDKTLCSGGAHHRESTPLTKKGRQIV